MKRFYKLADVAEVDGGYSVTLDGRSVRTPARALLAVPRRTLAEAMAAEWNAQGEDIDPRSMVFTGLANGAIDQIAPDPIGYSKGVAVYGESDLLCYRAESPSSLVTEQQQAWGPLLDWAQHRYDVAFAVATGIVHVPQPAETVARLAAAVAACDAFTLAGLSTLVTMSGSLVIGLAVLEKAFPIDQLWQASELDEFFQARLWGEDELAAKRRALREVDFAQAAEYLALLRA